MRENPDSELSTIYSAWYSDKSWGIKASTKTTNKRRQGTICTTPDQQRRNSLNGNAYPSHPPNTAMIPSSPTKHAECAHRGTGASFKRLHSHDAAGRRSIERIVSDSTLRLRAARFTHARVTTCGLCSMSAPTLPSHGVSGQA